MYSSQATCLRYFACMNTNTDDLYQNVVEHKLLAVIYGKTITTQFMKYIPHCY